MSIKVFSRLSSQETAADPVRKGWPLKTLQTFIRTTPNKKQKADAEELMYEIEEALERKTKTEIEAKKAADAYNRLVAQISDFTTGAN